MMRTIHLFPIQCTHASRNIFTTFLEADEAGLETSSTLHTDFFSCKKIRVLSLTARLNELCRWTFFCSVSRCIAPNVEKQTSARMKKRGTIVEGRRATNEEDNHTVHLFGSPFFNVTREQTFSLDSFDSDQHAL